MKKITKSHSNIYYEISYYVSHISFNTIVFIGHYKVTIILKNCIRIYLNKIKIIMNNSQETI